MTKTYEAIANHWNGACYSSDGEQFTAYDTLQAAIDAADQLDSVYNTDADGEPCDVDLQWEIYEVDEDCERGDFPVQIIRIQSSVGEAAQDACEIVAQHEDEFSTSYVGTDEDGRLVKWSRNGGSRGAHDRMDGNRGEWHETYEVPEQIDQLEWLRLAVKYGCDDIDSLTVDAIDLSYLESDADTDEAHWLDAAEQCWTLPVYSIDLVHGKRLAWSDTDEAGITDVALIDEAEWDGFAESLAESLGEVVDVEAGEHYTNHGVQYQHQAPGDYDHDGYRIVVRRREEA